MAKPIVSKAEDESVKHLSMEAMLNSFNPHNLDHDLVVQVAKAGNPDHCVKLSRWDGNRWHDYGALPFGARVVIVHDRRLHLSEDRYDVSPGEKGPDYSFRESVFIDAREKIPLFTRPGPILSVAKFHGKLHDACNSRKVLIFESLANRLTGFARFHDADRRDAVQAGLDGFFGVTSYGITNFKDGGPVYQVQEGEQLAATSAGEGHIYAAMSERAPVAERGPVIPLIELDLSRALPRERGFLQTWMGPGENSSEKERVESVERLVAVDDGKVFYYKPWCHQRADTLLRSDGKDCKPVLTVNTRYRIENFTVFPRGSIKD